MSQTVADHISIATEALQQQDISHALYHLSLVLHIEPDNTVAQRMLDKLIVESHDPFSLIPEKQPTNALEAILLAYLYGKLKKYEVALSLLTSIIQIERREDYAQWTVEWFKIPAYIDSIAPQVVVNFLVVLVDRYPGYMDNFMLSRVIKAIYPALRRLRDRHLDHLGLPFVVVRASRLAGLCPEAKEMAIENYDRHPNKLTAVSLGATLRKCGDLYGGLEAFKKALEYDPYDLHVPLDLGDGYCENGRYEEGLLYYQRVLRKIPNHPWARPHYLFYKFLLTQELPWRDQLDAYIAEHPANLQAQELGRRTKIRTHPYIDYLPSRQDAILNIGRQLAAGEITGEVNIGLSSLEAPSAFLTVQKLFEERNAKVVVHVAQIQKPDPRLPRKQVEYVLWMYNGTQPKPAISPPSTRISQEIAKIATQPYHLKSWKSLAKQFAKTLNDNDIPDLLGVMVHPPPCPEGIPIWDWIQQLQFAATLTIAYLNYQWDHIISKHWLFGKNSEPVPRKKALLSLLYGPMDWSVGSAAIVLSEVALDDSRREKEILAHLIDLYKNIPRPGGIPYLDALRVALLRLPSLSESLRLQLQMDV